MLTQTHDTLEPAHDAPTRRPEKQPCQRGEQDVEYDFAHILRDGRGTLLELRILRRIDFARVARRRRSSQIAAIAMANAAQIILASGTGKGSLLPLITKRPSMLLPVNQISAACDSATALPPAMRSMLAPSGQAELPAI